MRDYENEESSDFCATHKVEYFDSCPKCVPQLNGTLVPWCQEHIKYECDECDDADSLDDWIEQNRQNDQNFQDQDEQYTRSNS